MKVTDEDFKIESHYKNDKHHISYVLKKHITKLFGFKISENWEYEGYPFGEDNFHTYQFISIEDAKEYIKDRIETLNTIHTVKHHTL